MRRRSGCALLLLVLWGVGCAGTSNGTGAAPGVSMTADVLPLPLRLSRAQLTPDIHWVELAVEGGEPRRFVVAAPEPALLEQARPLVVFLHGGGGGRQLPQRLACLVQPAFARLAPIIVAPEAGSGEWWQEDPTGYVLGLTEAAVRDWPVRPDRVVIMGYSNGGIGTWFFARLYPEPFSAAIPMASNHAIVGESPLPIYAIHGDRDELFDVERVRESVSLLAAQGLDVQLQVRPLGVHGDACGYVPELEAAATWLENDVWQRPSP